MAARGEHIVEKALRHQDFVKALKISSYGNKNYAMNRLREYVKTFSNQHLFSNATDMMRTFSIPAGTSTTQTFPGYGTVLQLASLLANVSSFSGFLTIEKALDQPNMVLHFLDIIGTNVRDQGASSPVFPAVGPTKYDAYSLSPVSVPLSPTINTLTTNDTTPGFDNNSGNVQITNLQVTNALGVSNVLPILPFTVRFRFVFDELDASNNPVGTPYEVIAYDNGSGSIVFPENWGTVAGTIDYGRTGNPMQYANFNTLTLQFDAIGLRFASATQRRFVSVRLEFVHNYIDPIYYPTDYQSNRFVLKLTRTVQINTRPNQLILEMNKQELMAASKSLNVDIQPLVVEQLASIYQKYINRYIVGKYILRYWDGSATSTTRVDINVATPVGAPLTPLVSQYDQYTPILDKIRGGFEEIRRALAQKSFVAGKITALLVSPRMASWLARSSMLEQSLWVEEKVNYINDLYGYYIGIPVLRHNDLTALEAQLQTALGGTVLSGLTVGIGFAIAVLPENNLAPMARGIYLPVTQTPTVANFNNPVQEALSLFYQEETEVVAPELVVPFAFINLPVG